MKGGFAELRSPRDLLAKMEHDRRRMSADPTDTYAAFDFFLTAKHMLGWVFPDSPGKSQGAARQIERAREPLLAAVSHLANGAKHFRVTALRHKSIADVETEYGGFDPNSFSTSSFSPESFQFVGPSIEMENGSICHALDVADEVIAYWSQRV